MAKKKVDLSAEAEALGGEVEGYEEVDRELLLSLCPKDILPYFKKAKTDGQLVDLLYAVDKHRKLVNREVAEVETFQKKLEKYFIQKLPDNDSTGIAGEKGRVQVKHKSRPNVIDWSKLYEHIKKKGAFELLNRAPNVKAISERWEAGQQVPGVEKFDYKSVSLTKI